MLIVEQRSKSKDLVRLKVMTQYNVTATAQQQDGVFRRVRYILRVSHPLAIRDLHMVTGPPCEAFQRCDFLYAVATPELVVMVYIQQWTSFG